MATLTRKDVRKLPIMYREIELDRGTIDVEARTVKVAFSSELPVKRWFGEEVLDHSPNAVDLGRLRSMGSVLVDHDTRDLVGAVEQATIDGDRVGRATVRFGRSARAEEIFQDVRDGIRKAISVGYRINTLKLEKSDKQTGLDTYRAMKWTPHEISFVGVPADHTVGVGRDAAAGLEDVNLIGERSMEETAEERAAREAREAAAAAAQSSAATTSAHNEGVARERARVDELTKLGDAYKAHGGVEMAREMIASGKSPTEFKNAMLEKIGTREIPKTEIGMTAKETKRYSLLKLLNSMANPSDPGARNEAAFEWECAAAVLKAEKRDLRVGAQASIPSDIILQATAGMSRDLLVATGSMGGYTVATQLTGFIEMFRNRLALAQAGCQILTGLQGMIAIPKQTGGATAYWVAENNAPTESQQTLGQLTMTPKTVGAYTDISRRLLIQSSIDVENFVKTDLAKVLALAVDLAGLSGPGTGNQPTGILTSTSIGSTTGGTNGAAPTWQNIVDLETQIANANADVGSMRYMVNTKTRGKLKTTTKGTNVLGYIWENGDTPLNGYGATVSNQLRSTLTKGTTTGVCSEMLFGNFSDFIIGMWGGMDLMVDPYAGSTAGTVRVIVLQDVDVLMRHPESFSVMADILTT